MSERGLANRTLVMNTLAFTVCFAVWTMYGVLVTFLVDNKVLEIDKAQMGWLIGVPVLTGSIMRLPVGLLTDRYGGKSVYLGVMLFAAASVYLVSFAHSYLSFLLFGLLFGMSGAAFAVGIAFSSMYFPKHKQGFALGVFGVGNAGAAATTLGAPVVLDRLTSGGSNLEGWRTLPQIYAIALVAMAVLFALTTRNRKVEGAAQRTVGEMLRPLSDLRVWRFGLYYFLVFGAFVALSQWLVPYYLNVYAVNLATAGLLASIFSLPSGVVRALGGWVSDATGARTSMYWVLAACAVLFLMLVAPRMDIRSPGEGVMAERKGVVTLVTPQQVVVGEKTYKLKSEPSSQVFPDDKTLVWPTFQSWQEPVVKVGQELKKKELVAQGVTHVYFQANVWVFTGLVFLAGLAMGIGKAAVYKHIPEYYPNDVGVVGGVVGVIGGLGGFVCPILFGELLKRTGLWTSCWLFLAVVSVVCLVWMHIVILRMAREQDIERLQIRGVEPVLASPEPV
ncbi:MAG: MFS transporter [Armatimonadetes bacterium]|nr:MFS transporter [Armatimonadota bacterium]